MQVVGSPGTPVQVVPPRQRVTPNVQGWPRIASGGLVTQTRRLPWPGTHSSLAGHCASVRQVARQVVPPPGTPVHAVGLTHLETPGVHGSPTITGGARGVQMRTMFEPSTHSSVIAHCASLAQVVRHVVGPPSRPLQVVMPRHRVTPIMQASPRIASGGLRSQMRTEPCPGTHSSVVAQFVSVWQVRRQVRAPPIGPVHVVLPRQKVPPTVQGWPSVAVGSCGLRQTVPLQDDPIGQVAVQGREQ